MVGVLTSSVVDYEFSPGRVNPKIIKFAASLLGVIFAGLESGKCVGGAMPTHSLLFQ